MSREHDELDWCPFGMSGVARCEADKVLKAENDKLRELARAAWILFLKHGAVSPYELPEVDRVRESLNELGIKVSWEELGIEVEDD